MAILPPGVTAETFAAAIKEFEAAVGKAWVFTSDEDLAAYRDHFCYIKNQPNEFVPSAALGPNSTEQVQASARRRPRRRSNDRTGTRDSGLTRLPS